MLVYHLHSITCQNRPFCYSSSSPHSTHHLDSKTYPFHFSYLFFWNLHTCCQFHTPQQHILHHRHPKIYLNSREYLHLWLRLLLSCTCFWREDDAVWLLCQYVATITLVWEAQFQCLRDGSVEVLLEISKLSFRPFVIIFWG